MGESRDHSVDASVSVDVSVSGESGSANPGTSAPSAAAAQGFARNVSVLAFGQACLVAAMSLVVTTAPLVGADLLLPENIALATLPLAVLNIATMLTSIPAGLLMERIGRQRGFMFATLFGMAGGAWCSTAIMRGEFWMFTLGAAHIGVFNGFGNYFRFTAADSVDEAHKSRAVSYVMAGAVVAAFIGPNLASATETFMPEAPFAGSYASIIGIYGLALVAMTLLRVPHAPGSETEVALDAPKGRSLREIARQPRFVVAVICALVGYGVMALVMTATPLAMKSTGFDTAATSTVIQWHLVGMFAPSFFTGHLIVRFGVTRIMTIGAMLGLVCAGVNLAGTSDTHYLVALLSLGVSWNFLFIGATTMLTETYRPEERARVQAANDFIVFGTVAVAALSAGALHHHIGWEMVNIGVIPFMALALGSLAWGHRRGSAPPHTRPDLPLAQPEAEADAGGSV